MDSQKSTEFLEKLKALAQEHFPSLVAGELRAYLDKAQKVMVQNDELVSANKELQKKNLELTSDLSNLRNRESYLENKGLELIKKERELESKDKNLELVMVTYRNEQLVERVNELKTFVSLLVKNPRAIELMSTNHSETVPLRDNYGGLFYDTKVTQSNGTKEVVESKDEKAS